jgi:hypothetical protein
MFENTTRKNIRQFLIVWSILNLAGWIVGLIGVFLILSNLEYTNKFSSSRTFLTWVPLGTSIGLFQWLKLRRLGINIFLWVFITALGFSVLVTLYSWVLNFDSFDYREYNISDWVIYIGLAIAILIGGAIIGSLQSIVIGKHISSQGLWIEAYVFGLILPLAVGYLAYTFKAIFLNTLYFFRLYDIALGPGKFILLYGFLVLVTSIGISLYTGKALLKQSSLNAIP